MEERIQILEEEVAKLKREQSSGFGRDNFTSVDILRKNFQHKGSKLGFFGASMVGQQTDIGELTDSTGSSPNNLIDNVNGSGADGTINDNFSDLTAQVNDIRTVLRNLGLMA